MCTKTQYATQQEARKAIRGLGRAGKGHFECYLCPVCDAWHLTSARTKRLQPKQKGNRMQKMPPALPEKSLQQKLLRLKRKHN
jgi:hypothetical protein